MAIDMAPKDERRSATDMKRPPIARKVLLLVAAAIIGALALQSAAARLLARRAPDLVLSFAPHDAIALAAKAAANLAAGKLDTDSLAKTRAYADGALRRDVTRDDALVAFAATVQGRNADQRANAIVEQAENLTRRNFTAELWLIENAVRQGNVNGALRQFDIALRTNKGAGAVLFPVLRNALEEPALTGPIAQTIRGAPWRDPFLQYAVSLNRPSVALATVMSRQPALGIYQSADLRGALVQQLVDAKALDAAARLALGRPAGLVQDPDFSNSGGYPPFTWALSSGPDILSQRLREGNSSRLEVRADEMATGVAATQMIHAHAGRYVLAATMDDDKPGLSIKLDCVVDERELARLPVTSRTATTVTIPANCPYQFIRVAVSAGDTGSATWELNRVELIPEKS